MSRSNNGPGDGIKIKDAVKVEIITRDKSICKECGEKLNDKGQCPNMESCSKCGQLFCTFGLHGCFESEQ
jgi:ribosomal protein L37AE/L43A